METRLALNQATVAPLSEALRVSKATQVVDLCSGGRGGWPALLGGFAQEGLTPHVTLTDMFPNNAAFERVAAKTGGRISFHHAPVDARFVPRGLSGLRTLFNAFHHFRPDDATRVLRDAVSAAQGEVR